jgi:hypothetical protein
MLKYNIHTFHLEFHKINISKGLGFCFDFGSRISENFTNLITDETILKTIYVALLSGRRLFHSLADLFTTSSAHKQEERTGQSSRITIQE